MATATEIVRLVSEPSTSQTNIRTLFAAQESLKKAKEDRVKRYQKERADLIQLVANELKTPADAARAVPRQAELQNLETKFKGDRDAIDYMIDKSEDLLKELGDSNPEEMIAELTEIIKELEGRSKDTETEREKLKNQITQLQQKKYKLENMINAGQVSQTTQLPQTAQPTQAQSGKQGGGREQGSKN